MADCWQYYEGELDTVCICAEGVDVWCEPDGYCCCYDCYGCDLDD